MTRNSDSRVATESSSPIMERGRGQESSSPEETVAAAQDVLHAVTTILEAAAAPRSGKLRIGQLHSCITPFL